MARVTRAALADDPVARCAIRFYLHRLGQLEEAYRLTAERLLPLLDPDDDAAVAVRRVLEALEA